MSERIFMKVTNKDIANKLDKVFEIVQEFKDENSVQHTEIIVHQKETNGKVKVNEMRSKVTLSLVISVIVALVGISIKVIYGG